MVNKIKFILIISLLIIFNNIAFAVSETDFENMAQAIVDQYGSGINNNSRKSAIYSWLTDISYTEQRNFVLSYLEDYDYCNIISLADYSTNITDSYIFINTFFIGWNDTDDNYYYYDDGSENVIMKCSNQISRVYFRGSISHGSLATNGLSYSTTTTIGVSGRVNRSSAVTSLDKPIYTNNSKTDIDTGWTSLYNFPPTPQHNEIQFIKVPKVHDVYVGDNLQITTYGITKNNTYTSTKFGNLIVPSGYYITQIQSNMIYYDRSQQKWLEKIILLEVGEDLIPSNYRSSIVNFKWEDYNSSLYEITYSALINNNYIHEDCIYTLDFSGYYLDSSQPFMLINNFYIIGSNTILNGDDLDTSNLDSGNYSDSYLNDVNDILGNIDDQNDLINGIEQGIGNGFIIQSGDFFPLNSLSSGDNLLATAQLWGFKNYGNSYWENLYIVFQRTTTILTQSGNVTLDISTHGINKTLNSSDFNVPNGAIKTFISSALVWFTCFIIYKHFSKKIEKVKTADSTVLKHEVNNDSDLM